MAEQYSWISANNEGYTAGKDGGTDGNIRPWSRATVADGKWLNKEMILPFSGRDQYLLDSLNQTYDECSAFSGDLQSQINVIEARTDVIDVVGNHDIFVAKYGDPAALGPEDISDGDIIKVLNDATTDYSVLSAQGDGTYVTTSVSPSGVQSYYRYLSAHASESLWEYVGYLEPYYNNASFAENAFNLENTDSRRNYTINTDINRFIQMSTAGNTGTIGITDDFISSASQVYNALSSISGINEGSISGPRVNHTVSNYSLAQGSANSASYDSFAQGKRNYAYSQSIAAGVDNYAKNQSQALGNNNSAYSDGFAVGSNNSATLAASFAQGSTNYAYNSSFAQGTNNSASTQSFAQGKDNSAYYDAFAQGLSAFANNESLAQGLEVTAKNKSFAQGSKNNADIYGFAQGTNCSATTTGFAQGDKCKANNIALAQGQYASANDYSMAQGQKVYANYVSFAEGEVASATSVAFAQGNDVIADSYSFVQGHMASATNMSMAQGHNGVIAYQTSFAQGQQVSAKDRGMAQGINANANNNSFAQGYDVTATTAAFAQGNTVKSNYYSISQGLRTVADNYSISQGTNTSAQYYSIAQGNATTADDYSQSFGLGTKMLHSGMAIGTFNKSDNIPFVIGNGTSDDNRSDLFLINRNGDVSAKGDISAKNFYLDGNPLDSAISILNTYSGKWVSAISAKNGVLNGPVIKFKINDDNGNLYLNVNPSENQIHFGLSDIIDLKRFSTDTYTAKPLIRLGTEGPGTIKYSAALNGYIVSAYADGPGWSNPVTATGSWFDIINSMPNTAQFSAKGNPNNFNQTFNYGELTLSAGEGIGFYNAGTNSLGISAQAGIPDGTIVWRGLTAQGTVGEKNLNKLCIADYSTQGGGASTRYYQYLEYSAGLSTNKFNLWSTTASTASNLVDSTIIPVIDPVSNSYKNEYTTLRQLGEALNIGNYVSAGNGQKLTMISADNLALGSMLPGVIYLV